MSVEKQNTEDHTAQKNKDNISKYKTVAENSEK